MQRALDLARRAEGQTRPNPMVGAVVVRDGEVLGEGWHARAGEPHAERIALAACKVDPAGATMYVTLEPCRHHGRTPPCTEAILGAGITRVVVAAADPNAKAGGGAELLRDAGLAVEVGVLGEESRLMNPAFHTRHALERPLVTLKWAMGADGCTSADSGHSKWISSAESRREVHLARAAHDAVLVGVETAMTDGARLTVRDIPHPPGPPILRVVLDSAARLPVNHPVVEEGDGAVVVCTDRASADRRAALESAGAQVWVLPADADGRPEIGALATRLAEAGVQSVLVEGGRRVAGSFLAAGMVDRVMAFVAPVLIGAGEQPLSALLMKNPITKMEQAPRLLRSRWRVFGQDALLEGWLTSHLFDDTIH